MYDAIPPQAAVTQEEAPPSGVGPLYPVWTVVYLLNLPLPLGYGWIMTRESGRAGMFLAVLLLFAIGSLLCRSLQDWGVSLIVGGGLVAASQPFPILQIVAGSVGMAAARAVGQVTTSFEGDPGSVDSEPGGFLVTAFTGGLLMVVALVLGVTIRAALRVASHLNRGAAA